MFDCSHLNLTIEPSSSVTHHLARFVAKSHHSSGQRKELDHLGSGQGDKPRRYTLGCSPLPVVTQSLVKGISTGGQR